MEDTSLLEQELFIVRQRLHEVEMALEEAAGQKDELRATAATLMIEVRAERTRAAAADGLVRRADTERARTEEKLALRTAERDALAERLIAANDEFIAAHATNDERDLLIDSLQLQIMELRLALARARGFERV